MANLDLVDYSRQADLDNKITNIKNRLHVIVGCGGIGYWLGIQLAMMGATNFLLVEGDKIEASNLNRLPVPQTWIGKNKAIALMHSIHFIRPLANIVVMQKHITEETLEIFDRTIQHMSSRVSLAPITIWDCTDNARIQVVLSKKFANVYHYNKLGYEALDVGCYSKMDCWIDEATYQPGYRTSNANAVTSAISAGLGILYEGLNKDKDLNINLEALVGGEYAIRK